MDVEHVVLKARGAVEHAGVDHEVNDHVAADGNKPAERVQADE